MYVYECAWGGLEIGCLYAQGYGWTGLIFDETFCILLWTLNLWKQLY